MSHFELIMGAISIVVSFTAIRLLDGLREAFRLDRRYWVHGLWIINRIL